MTRGAGTPAAITRACTSASSAASERPLSV